MRSTPMGLFSASVTILLSLLMTGRVGAQSPDQRDRWTEVYKQEATQYKMLRRGEEEEVLQLEKTPVLTFTNPVRERDTHGAAFVWTSDGRPEVFAAIWSVISPQDSTKRHLSHEFHSLSLSGIASEHEPRISPRGPVPDWSTMQPGIERKPIPKAPAPAGNKNLRLIQMRRLAKGFDANIPQGLGDGQGSLRLLTQPVYRFSSARHGVLDGAIFVFGMGTDPELLVLIEAVESGNANAESVWHFSAAPVTNLPLMLDYQGTRVWQCERSRAFVNGLPHFLFWAASLRDRELGDDE